MIIVQKLKQPVICLHHHMCFFVPNLVGPESLTVQALFVQLKFNVLSKNGFEKMSFVILKTIKKKNGLM